MTIFKKILFLLQRLFISNRRSSKYCANVSEHFPKITEKDTKMIRTNTTKR